MKLTIFGATGGVGANLTSQAIANGHNVRAVSRHPDNIRQSSGLLEKINGDVLDPALVKSAVKDADVVFCALGMPLLNKDRLRTKGTRNIINAMNQTGVKRLICLSGLGAGDSRTLLPALHRYVLRPTLMRRLYKDHEEQEKLVMQSNLDWTLARPGSFVVGRQTGKYHHGFTAKIAGLTFKISREDVADFMLAQLDSDTYARRAVNLSY